MMDTNLFERLVKSMTQMNEVIAKERAASNVDHLHPTLPLMT